jgi:hypothetical protein
VEFEVVDMDGRRIDKVMVKRVEDLDAEDGSGTHAAQGGVRQPDRGRE